MEHLSLFYQPEGDEMLYSLQSEAFCFDGEEILTIARDGHWHPTLSYDGESWWMDSQNERAEGLRLGGWDDEENRMQWAFIDPQGQMQLQPRQGFLDLEGLALYGVTEEDGPEQIPLAALVGEVWRPLPDWPEALGAEGRLLICAADYQPDTPRFRGVPVPAPLGARSRISPLAETP
jgi:hypothetical protein